MTGYEFRKVVAYIRARQGEFSYRLAGIIRVARTLKIMEDDGLVVNNWLMIARWSGYSKVYVRRVLVWLDQLGLLYRRYPGKRVRKPLVYRLKMPEGY